MARSKKFENEVTVTASFRLPKSMVNWMKPRIQKYIVKLSKEKK